MNMANSPNLFLERYHHKSSIGVKCGNYRTVPSSDKDHHDGRLPSSEVSTLVGLLNMISPHPQGLLRIV